MINLKYMVLIPFLMFKLIIAQNGSWWQPEFPFKGDTIKIFFNAAQNSEIPDNATSLVLHWGINEIGEGNWNPPPSYLWPEGTVLHSSQIAVRSPMTNVNGIWQIAIPTDQTVTTLHYVVNTGTPAASGSYWGHNTGGGNWNINLLAAGISAIFAQPQVDTGYGNPDRSPVFMNSQDSLAIVGIGIASGISVDSMILFINEDRVAAIANDTITYLFNAAEYPKGYVRPLLIAKSTDGPADTSSASIMVNPVPEISARPEGIRDGINYIDATTVTLSLFAPYKDFVYVIGDFNECDWKVDTDYYMKRDEVNADSVHWWITLTGITPGNEYAFQYLVDGTIRIADPYVEKILDPWNDQYISSATYPNLKPYPAGKTSQAVAVIETGQPAFNWQYTAEYQRPPQDQLVIYEVLLRDFLHAHDFKTLLDTLDYLDNLGINAIELMPVNEFEGNSSWGYNPSFYFAVDKYYGPAEDLKRLIDECHRRGIAVILDMVLNHSFGQSPMVRLYWDSINNRPAANNPWFNPIPKHPYNVGYDFNHASPSTQYLVDRVNAFWLTEFKVDGFRFDLSKGFTQRYNTDVGAWGTYDASRITILKRMADKIWQVDSTAYIILEHFAENSEEFELSEYGIMLWGNMNSAYSQSTMGWLEDAKISSNLASGYYINRGWNKPNLITYMESHDEPWIMYKNIQYGRSSGNYDIKNPNTALNRMKLAAAFLFTLPGPKMIWQFGELGYDQNLPDNGRTDPKPILWNYYQQDNRRKLYKVFSALLKLRSKYDVFHSTSTTVSMRVGQGQYDRRINLSHPSMNAVIIGNFNVTTMSIYPNFQSIYIWWYDFFSGDSIYVSDPNALLILQPGEFHIYTDKKLETPEGDILNAIEDENIDPLVFNLNQNYPNPFNPVTNISFHIPVNARVNLYIYDILGRKVATLIEAINLNGSYSVDWDGRDQQGRSLSSGVYFYKIQARIEQKIVYEQSRKMVLVK